jgi:tRNA/rRNA methyltransferase
LDLKVVLVEPLYEANIGYVARVMKNFGVKDLYIVNPRTDVGREASMFAAHARDVIESVNVSQSLEEAIEDTDIVIGTTARPGKSGRNVLRSTSDPAIIADRVISSGGNVAVVLGRDTTGLSNEELRLCDLVLTIPTDAGYPTMNLSHAATVILYELFKAYRKRKGARKMGSDREALKRLMGLFKELMTYSRLPTHKSKLASRAFRNIIFRSCITRRETSLLIGVFRKNLRLIEQYSRSGSR